MTQTTRIITELCRHELLRERRSFHFSRNILIWTLYLVMWLGVSVSLVGLFQQMSLPYGQYVLLLLLTDHILRWFTQKTPKYDIHHYSLLPLRRWQFYLWYSVRLLFLPLNFIWLPALWPHWWLILLFVLNGYIYAICWHAYVATSRKINFSPFTIIGRESLLTCDLKLRFRHPALQQKIRNGLVASVMLILLSTLIDQQYYTDFAVLYTLTFPSLPLLSARWGYEQSYMSLLQTRMHGLSSLYLNKYLASLLMLIPSVILLILPVALHSLDCSRLLLYLLLVALVIYPMLVRFAPRCEVSSPTAQITTLFTLTIPIVIINLI